MLGQMVSLSDTIMLTMASLLQTNGWQTLKQQSSKAVNHLLWSRRNFQNGVAAK
jgi:hypothetical protein